MGLGELEAALRDEAAALINTIISEAEERAGSILRAAGAEADELEAAGQELILRGEAAEERLLNMRRAARERVRLTMDETAHISAIKNRCREMYRDFVRSNEYEKFIESEFRLVALELGKKITVVADDRTLSILRRVAGEGVEFGQGKIEDGFVASSAYGRLEISCAFDGRFESLWRVVAPVFVKRISAGGARGGL